MNWIISELFYPDEVSTAQIITDIALHKVINEDLSVICGPSGYENLHTSKKKLDERIKIYRIGLPKLNKNILFQRLLRLLILTIKMSWIVFIKVKKNDTVFITTNPAFLIISISIIKKIKGFHLEILVHDVFPENLVPAKMINKNSFKYNFLSKIYNSSYRNANRIIVLGEDMKELVVQKIAPKKIRVDIVPNWHDEDIYPLSDFNISEYLEINVKDKIVIGFAGNIGRVQGILEFIDLVKRAENPNLALVIFGDGALKSSLIEKIENGKFQNVYYLGSKGRSEQNLFLNACHIGLVTLINGMKGLGVPSKTYNLMAAGKPLLYLGDHYSEIDNYVRNYNCGWSFNWENENEVLSYLRHLSLKDLSDINEKGVKSRIASKNFKKDFVLNLF